MNDFLQLLVEYLRTYNSLFLGIVIILSYNGLPLGASFLVIAMGAFSFLGEYNFYAILIEVWIFSFVGDISCYQLWKYFGDRLMSVERIKRRLKAGLKKSEILFNKYGPISIFFTRFPASGFGAFLNILAGMTKWNFKSFFFWVVLGDLIWAIFYMGIGYLFGDAWEEIAVILDESSQVLTYFIIISIGGLLLYRNLKRIRLNNRKK